MGWNRSMLQTAIGTLKRGVSIFPIVSEYIQLNILFLCFSTTEAAMSGNVVSTCHSKPWVIICHSYRTLLVLGIMFCFALSMWVNSWGSPSVITILIFCKTCLGSNLGNKILNTHWNIQYCWLGKKTLKKWTSYHWHPNHQQSKQVFFHYFFW